MTSKWISVKEKLPAVNVMIIMCGDKDDVEAGYYTGEGRWPWVFAEPMGYQECYKCYTELELPFADNGWKKESVTHWMPFPDPPEIKT